MFQGNIGQTTNSRFGRAFVLFVCLFYTTIIGARANDGFKYDVIAMTGQTGLTSINGGISINNKGRVAFSGQLSDGSGLFYGDGTGAPININPANSHRQSLTYSSAVQINNLDQVLARELIGGNPPLSYAQYWDSNALNTRVEVAVGWNGHPPFDAIFAYDSINDSNQVVFSALSNTSTILATGLQPIFNKVTVSNTTPASLLRPMLDNNGDIVLRTPDTQTSPIVLYSYDLSSYKAIASANTGFTRLGRSPGISSDGKIIAFAGIAGNNAPVHPGPGIFVAISAGTGWVIKRVAGISGDGYLDPGETFIDSNANGIFDTGETDTGPLAAFSLDDRVSVNDHGIVVYKATGTDNKTGIYCSLVDIDRTPSSWRVYDGLTYPLIHVLAPGVVAETGDSIPGLSGPIQGLAVYDSLNNNNVAQVAFWVDLGNSQNAIVRATGCPASIVTTTVDQPHSLVGANWSMTFRVSQKEGLVVEGVKLANRYLTNKISVPYFRLSTLHNAAPQRGELRPSDSTGVSLRSRLVDLTTEQAANHLNINGEQTSESDKIVVTATFAIDGIAPQSANCLLVTQRYEFYAFNSAEVNEPSGELTAQKFRPIVSYRYLEDDGNALDHVNVVQRLYAQPEQRNYTNLAVFHDNALLQGGLIFDFVKPLFSDPLMTAAQGVGILGGQQADWDNLHWTFLDTIQEPIVTRQSLRPHGASEALHIHWRWSYLASVGAGLPFTNAYNAFNVGAPLVPDGSNQSLLFGVVPVKPGEDNPTNYLDIVNEDVQNKDPLTSAGTGNQAAFFSAFGFQNQDRFFEFGGFYAPTVAYEVGEVTQHVKVTRTRILPVRSPRGHFRQLVTVQSTEDFKLIPAPLYLVLDGLTDATHGVQLFNKSGIAQNGSPYISVDLGPDGNLEPNAGSLPGQYGETVKVWLDFYDPRSRGIGYQSIQFTPRVFAGSGSP